MIRCQDHLLLARIVDLISRPRLQSGFLFLRYSIFCLYGLSMVVSGHHWAALCRQNHSCARRSGSVSKSEHRLKRCSGNSESCPSADAGRYHSYDGFHWRVCRRERLRLSRRQFAYHMRLKYPRGSFAGEICGGGGPRYSSGACPNQLDRRHQDTLLAVRSDQSRPTKQNTL